MRQKVCQKAFVKTSNYKINQLNLWFAELNCFEKNVNFELCFRTFQNFCRFLGFVITSSKEKNDIAIVQNRNCIEKKVMYLKR